MRGLLADSFYDDVLRELVFALGAALFIGETAGSLAQIAVIAAALASGSPRLVVTGTAAAQDPLAALDRQTLSLEHRLRILLVVQAAAVG